MKRYLLSAALIALGAPVALAADLPVYEPAPMVAPNPATWDWSGAFIGVHGGYGWGDLNNGDSDFSFDKADLKGAVIGGQVGYNWQWNQFVLGVEADGSWADVKDDGGNFGLDKNKDDVGYRWLASARGKAGFAWERFLVYGTGGAAFGGFDASVDNNNSDEAQFGWVGGGGVEFMLTRNVTLGAEFLHYDFNDVISDNDAGNVDSSVNVARGRVNIKFSSLFGGG